MHPAFDAVGRARTSRRMAQGSLVMAVLSATLALVSTSVPARAAAVVSGAIEVSALPLPVNLSCTGCPLGGSASSSGDISGVDGTTAFEASWVNTGSASFSISGTYDSGCAADAWGGAQINGGSAATVAGVSLVYGGVTYSNASVKITFLGAITEGDFAPITETVEIDGGPHAISVFVPEAGDPGSLATVPMTPPSLCPGSQTFSATGTFVTLG